MMKGAIAHINPALHVIDLTHHIPPQDIAQARFVLMSAFPYFPAETVHVAVVDPGVGSDRRGVAVAIGSSSDDCLGYLVAPDNGLLSGVLEQYPVWAAVELTQSDYWRSLQPSHTFHGRDIFAPVAAHLASGVPLLKFGPTIALETLYRLNLPPLSRDANRLQGCIQAIDHFGNLITNIPASEVAQGAWAIDMADVRLPSVRTYSDRPPGIPITLIGSHGWVEIAIVNGNAHQRFKLRVGDLVQVIWQS